LITAQERICSPNKAEKTQFIKVDRHAWASIKHLPKAMRMLVHGRLQEKKVKDRMK
jgi:hypothetical protein